MLEEIESVIKDRKSAVSSQRNDVMFVSLKYLMTIMPDHTATKACETTQKGIAPLFVSLDTLHRLRPFIPQVSLAIKTKGSYAHLVVHGSGQDKRVRRAVISQSISHRYWRLFENFT